MGVARTRCWQTLMCSLAALALTVLAAGAALVQTERAYRVHLSKGKSQLEWHSPTAEGDQVLIEEPDSTWWQRPWLNLIGPLVPEDAL